jgi:hypothetical protein
MITDSAHTIAHTWRRRSDRPQQPDLRVRSCTEHQRVHDTEHRDDLRQQEQSEEHVKELVDRAFAPRCRPVLHLR